MKASEKALKGQSLSEFAILALLVSLPLWYLIMGDNGMWDSAPAAQTPCDTANATKAGVLQCLDERQHDFINSINQP